MDPCETEMKRNGADGSRQVWVCVDEPTRSRRWRGGERRGEGGELLFQLVHGDGDQCPFTPASLSQSPFTHSYHRTFTLFTLRR